LPIACELVIWTQRLTFAELRTECAPVWAVVLDVPEGAALAAREALAEREAAVEGDGLADGECDEDEWPFARGEALGLAFGEAVLAAFLCGLVAWCVPVLALLFVFGDFVGVGFGVALLVAEAFAAGAVGAWVCLTLPPPPRPNVLPGLTLVFGLADGDFGLGVAVGDGDFDGVEVAVGVCVGVGVGV
jgi:hypothetical protein